MPEVDEAIIVWFEQTSSIFSKIFCFISSLSGTLSMIKSAFSIAGEISLKYSKFLKLIVLLGKRFL